MKILLLLAWRQLVRQRLQSALTLLGIALGVAVVVAVDLANESSSRALERTLDALTGTATHHIVGPPRGFDEALYLRLRLQGVRASAPVVEGFIRIGGETWRLLGIDPLAESRFRPQVESTDEGALRRLMVEPGSVLAPPRGARHADAEGRMVAEAGGRTEVLRLAGTYRSNAGIDDLLLADIATAQTLLDRVGRLDRIDLQLSASQVEEVAAMLPPGLHVEEAEARRGHTEQLARAFQINLRAMSLLALLVGAFLVYNTVAFGVIRHRELLGTLRAVGATPHQVVMLVMGQALLMGTLGTVLGVLGGLVLGDVLLALVTRTINDLYFVLSVREVTVAPGSLLLGGGMGVAVTLLAAGIPAREAARVAPLTVQRRSHLERRTGRGALIGAVVGAPLILIGLLLPQLAERSLLAGFVALGLIMIGAGALVPLLVAGIGAIGSRVVRGVLGRRAVRGLSAGLSRSGIAVAALAIAVSATVGVTVMVDSFRVSVADWLEAILVGDVYVAPPGTVSSRVDGTLDPSVVERFRALPGVAAVRGTRRVEVMAESGPVSLLAVEAVSHTRDRFTLLAGEPESAWQAFRAGEAVFASEPLAFHRRIEPGDRIELMTDRGMREFPVAAIYRDYGSEAGVVAMGMSIYRQLWDDPDHSSLVLYAAPGVPTDTLLANARAAAAELSQTLEVRSNEAIRSVSLAIFDRTFTVTRVLRLLTVLVAAVGIFGALSAMQIERAREHALLRSLGVTPGGLFLLVGLETALLGLVAGLVAIPLGVVTAEVLIDVINRRAFGWSMDLVVPPAVPLEALTLAVGSALAAGIYPAWRMARTPPALALREE